MLLFYKSKIKSSKSFSVLGFHSHFVTRRYLGFVDRAILAVFYDRWEMASSPWNHITE